MNQDKQSELLPCPDCGADCSVQVFNGEHIVGEAVPLWMCANSRALGGTCERDAFFDAEAWNLSRPSLSTPSEGVIEALEWFGGQHALELYYYCPTYGDDDDLDQEWRIDRVSGGINDRERDVVGRGETPLAAIREALARISPLPLVEENHG